MVRKALYALALIAATATTAVAGKLHVVYPHGLDGSTDAQAYDNYLSWMKAVLEKLGVDAVFMRQDAVADRTPYRSSNSGIKDSVFTDDLGRQQTFAGRLVLDWVAGAGVGNRRLAGVNPDALTLAAGWPQIPTALIGPTRQTGGGVINSTASCSTSVSGASISANGWGAPPGSGFEVTSYLPGTGLRWKWANNYYRLDGTTLGQWRLSFNAPGITRNIVGVFKSNAAYGADGQKSCDDCDGSPNPVNDSYTADSTHLWARYRSAREPAPLFFSVCLYCTNSGLDYPTMNLVFLIAAMDSASGGRIIGQKRGWTPLKFGIGVDNGLVHSDCSQGGDLAAYCGVNPRDSTYIKAHLDSLGALGVPWTAFVNSSPDTLDRYAGELKWFGKNGAKFSPSPRKGLGVAYAPGANGAAITDIVDPWGAVRSRTMLTLDRLNNGTPCDGTTDSTTSCILEYAKSALESRLRSLGYRDRMSRALLAYQSDYVPSNFTARDLPGQGVTSPEAAALRAGFTHLLGSTTPFGVNAAAQYAIGAGFLVKINESPWFGNIRMPYAAKRTVRVYGQTATVTPTGQTVYAPTDLVGTVKWVLYRQADGPITSSTNEAGGHPLPEEFFYGMFTNNWYPTQVADTYNRSNFYYHTFRSTTDAIIVPLGTMGSTDASGARVQTPGWWYIKHSVNQARAVNKLAGRDIFRIVHLDEL